MSTLHRLRCLLVLALVPAVMAACGAEAPAPKTLYIGGIPDQDVSKLEAMFNGVAKHLTAELGMPVKYVPSSDYAAVVTEFARNDIQLAWYGGLTGVQARLQTPGAAAIAQRPRDEAFQSVFIAQKGQNITKLADLKGKSFTFGSESSTSGHLMPRYFLLLEKLTPEADFASFSYSGSHDQTWKLVEAGSFHAGALNKAAWDQRVKNNEIDLSKVEVFRETPPYYDYHWVVRGDVDKHYGAGVTAKIKAALLGMSMMDEKQRKTLEGFQTDRFIETKNENYAAIEAVARELKIVGQT